MLHSEAETLSKQLKCGEPAVAAVEDNSAHKSVDAVRNNPRPAGKDQKAEVKYPKVGDVDKLKILGVLLAF